MRSTTSYWFRYWTFSKNKNEGLTCINDKLSKVKEFDKKGLMELNNRPVIGNSIKFWLERRNCRRFNKNWFLPWKTSYWNPVNNYFKSQDFQRRVLNYQSLKFQSSTATLLSGEVFGISTNLQYMTMKI